MLPPDNETTTTYKMRGTTALADYICSLDQLSFQLKLLFTFFFKYWTLLYLSAFILLYNSIKYHGYRIEMEMDNESNKFKGE